MISRIFLSRTSELTKLAYLPAHFLDSAEGKRRGHQDGAGAAPARHHQDDAGGVRAGGHPGQASGAVESRRDVEGESRGKVKHPLLLDLSGPLRIQPKTRKLLE